MKTTKIAVIASAALFITGCASVSDNSQEAPSASRVAGESHASPSGNDKDGESQKLTSFKLKDETPAGWVDPPNDSQNQSIDFFISNMDGDCTFLSNSQIEDHEELDSHQGNTQVTTFIYTPDEVELVGYRNDNELRVRGEVIEGEKFELVLSCSSKKNPEFFDKTFKELRSLIEVDIANG